MAILTPAGRVAPRGRPTRFEKSEISEKSQKCGVKKSKIGIFFFAQTLPIGSTGEYCGLAPFLHLSGNFRSILDRFFENFWDLPPPPGQAAGS